MGHAKRLREAMSSRKCSIAAALGRSERREVDDGGQRDAELRSLLDLTGVSVQRETHDVVRLQVTDKQEFTRRLDIHFPGPLASGLDHVHAIHPAGSFVD